MKYILFIPFAVLSILPLSAQFLDVKPIREISGVSYMNDTLSFHALYQSVHKKEYIENWVAHYLYSSNNESDFVKLFIPVAQKVLKRTISEDKKTAISLVGDLINFFEQYGIDTAAEQIAVFASEKGLEDEKIVRLVVTSRLTGKPAPLLSTGQELRNTVLVFYESGCGSCDTEMENLENAYLQLKSKGYEVVSISTDVDETVFKNNSKTFPWRDKYCDLQGFDGKDIIEYGVIGTPTFYVIDNEGIIAGRYARLQDTGILE